MQTTPESTFIQDCTLLDQWTHHHMSTVTARSLDLFAHLPQASTDSNFDFDSQMAALNQKALEQRKARKIEPDANVLELEDDQRDDILQVCTELQKQMAGFSKRSVRQDAQDTFYIDQTDSLQEATRQLSQKHPQFQKVCTLKQSLTLLKGPVWCEKMSA